MYQADYRENTVTALETATNLTAKGAETPGVFVVPSGVSKITEIVIQAVSESTVDNIMGASTCIHLTGGGINVKLGYFLGPCFTTGGAAATTPGGGFYNPMKYHTNIPCTPGGQIRADAFMMGEDVGAVHMSVGLVYDGTPGKIIDGDIRNLDNATSNQLYTLTERADATVEGDFRVPYTLIGEVFVAAGAKVTAGNDAVTMAYHLSGPGLIKAGNYEWVGPGIALNDDTAISMNCVNCLPFRYQCGAGIKIQPNGFVRAQSQMLEGDVGTAWAVIGLGFYA